MTKALMDFLGLIFNSIMEGIRPEGLIQNNLTFESSQVSWTVNAWNAGGIRVIAVGLTILFFILELNRAYFFDGRELSYKTIAVPFVKLAVAVTVLKYAGGLITIILNTSNALVRTMGGVGPNDANEPPLDALNDSVKGMGWITLILAILIMIIFWLISQVIMLVFLYKILLFKMEFIIRIIFTPVALADVYSGMHSNAVRWLKALFALALYGACFIIIPKIGAAFMNSLITDAVSDGGEGVFRLFKLLIMAFVVPIAELGMLGVAKQVTKEALV